MYRMLLVFLVGVVLLFDGSRAPLLAQAVDTTIATTPAAPVTSPTDLLGVLVTLTLGLVTPFLMQGLEWLSSWLKRQSPLTKRLVVSAIPNLVVLACAYLSRHFPWFPWDPGPVNALIATSIAFGVHAGDAATAAKRTTGSGG